MGHWAAGSGCSAIRPRPTVTGLVGAVAAAPARDPGRLPAERIVVHLVLKPAAAAPRVGRANPSPCSAIMSAAPPSPPSRHTPRILFPAPRTYLPVSSPGLFVPPTCTLLARSAAFRQRSQRPRRSMSAFFPLLPLQCSRYVRCPQLARIHVVNPSPWLYLLISLVPLLFPLVVNHHLPRLVHSSSQHRLQPVGHVVRCRSSRSQLPPAPAGSATLHSFSIPSHPISPRLLAHSPISPRLLAHSPSASSSFPGRA